MDVESRYKKIMILRTGACLNSKNEYQYADRLLSLNSNIKSLNFTHGWLNNGGKMQKAPRRGIEPRSPALIENDKRKSSPLDHRGCLFVDVVFELIYDHELHKSSLR